MPYVELDGARVYYETHGAGAPLVLIPGFGAGAWIWFKQVPALERACRVILFDPRGVGRSVARDEPFSTKLLADDVAALLDHLGIERADVAGASFGGFVALEFALEHPDRLNKLILCCTSAGGAMHVAPDAEVLVRLASTQGLNTDERMRENLLLAFSPEYVARERDEVERVIALRAACPVPEFVYRRQLQAALTFDTGARLGAISSPTLVITGDADRIVPAENSRRLAAAIPRSRLQVIAGGSHSFFIEQAEDFNRAVLDFLFEDQRDCDENVRRQGAKGE